VLAGMRNLSAVYVLSHGTLGAVSLGSATLSQATLAAYSAELKAIGASPLVYATRSTPDLLDFSL
jgi:hypothetical protein